MYSTFVGEVVAQMKISFKNPFFKLKCSRKLGKKGALYCEHKTFLFPNFSHYHKSFIFIFPTFEHYHNTFNFLNFPTLPLE